MSDKYIIKNCPAYSETQGVYWTCYEDNNKLLCQDCTDCILKQIVKKCKHVKAINKTNSYVGEYIEFTQRSPLADEILDLLDIEECK